MYILIVVLYKCIYLCTYDVMMEIGLTSGRDGYWLPPTF